MAQIVNKFGKLAGWNSITFRLFGRDVVGISKIKYGDNQAITNKFGAGNLPVGEEEGNIVADDLEIDLLQEEYMALIKSIPPGKRLQDATGDCLVEYAYAGEKFNDIIHNVRFMNNGTEINQGDGSITRSFKCKVSHITHNA